jgi:hypothetical protein
MRQEHPPNRQQLQLRHGRHLEDLARQTPTQTQRHREANSQPPGRQPQSILPTPTGIPPFASHPGPAGCRSPECAPARSAPSRCKCPGRRARAPATQSQPGSARARGSLPNPRRTDSCNVTMPSKGRSGSSPCMRLRNSGINTSGLERRFTRKAQFIGFLLIQCRVKRLGFRPPGITFHIAHHTHDREHGALLHPELPDANVGQSGQLQGKRVWPAPRSPPPPGVTPVHPCAQNRGRPDGYLQEFEIAGPNTHDQVAGINPAVRSLPRSGWII